jgi:hypothetical protein
MTAFVQEVKEFALAHYAQGGWDVILECWDDSEIEEILTNAKGDEIAAWSLICALVEVWADQQAFAASQK